MVVWRLERVGGRKRGRPSCVGIFWQSMEPVVFGIDSKCERVGHISPRWVKLMVKTDFLFWTSSFSGWVGDLVVVNDAQQGFSKRYLHVREVVNKQDGLWCQWVERLLSEYFRFYPWGPQDWTGWRRVCSLGAHSLVRPNEQKTWKQK